MLQSVISRALLFVFAASGICEASCPPYENYSLHRHPPYSSGVYKLSYMRPSPECRTFKSPEVEHTVRRLKNVIKDPDLYRLFENSFPNSLDTAVKYKGFAAGSDDEDLTFLITGDINAMWLRDSANQMQSYVGLLKPSNDSDSLASLFRGVINLQSRYLQTSPFCNSFQPPTESGLKGVNNSGADIVKPTYNVLKVWECKYELDSLAAFLEISTDYYKATKDISFFKSFTWIEGVKAALGVANAMRTATYAKDGSVLSSPYTFLRPGIYPDSLINSGKGSPVQSGTGLIRSAFRPSDDGTLYQFLIPSNMMFSRYLKAAAAIVAQIPGNAGLARQMRQMSAELREAISAHGILNDPKYGRIYAYEVDGYGSSNQMDDANIPSLLAAPVFGYLGKSDAVYQNTRRKLLSRDNPYYAQGPVFSSIGGPHDGPGRGWPMARIVAILTSDDDAEIVDSLQQLVSSTDGLGLIHESINAFNQKQWTRQWFSWANGLFGQMILDLEKRKPEILKMSFQGS